MTTTRSVQLSKLRTLYELREKQARTKMREHQQQVLALEFKAKEIQDCVNAFVEQLKDLDETRLQAKTVTVDLLQEEAARRLVVERDLRKERFYLETAVKDVEEAQGELIKTRALWRSCCNRVEALGQLEQNQQASDAQQSQLRVDGEMDDLALSRHGGASRHG